MFKRDKSDKVDKEIRYEDLPDYIKEMFTPESWQSTSEALRAREEEARKRRQRPKDWVEPSMSLEEIEADPFTLDVGKRMREKGMTRVTRSEYLELFYGTKKPRPWTPEMEEEMPNKLVDPYVKFTG
jgi:hypothetical protein